MKKMPIILVLVFALAGSLFCAAAAAGEFTYEQTVSASELTVSNLIGEVKVVPAEGDEFAVKIEVAGKDAAEDLFEIKLHRGDDAELKIMFPVEEHRSYVYPPMGGSKVKISPERGGKSFIDKLLGLNRQVRVRGDGDGLHMWADVTVAVPRGKSLKFYNGVGDMAAGGVEGDVLLDGSWGKVLAVDIRGEVSVDTGSGSVAAERIRGRLHVDTGSGGVKMSDIEGSVMVDTGSGRVTGVDLDCRKLVVDTGSGGIQLHRAGADAVRLDTGSGDVEIELLRMSAGDYVIDTGSGGVRVRLPADSSVRIEADTGSGGIKWDLGDVDVRHKEKNEALLIVGGGAADMSIDTGSGSIRITQ